MRRDQIRVSVAEVVPWVVAALSGQQYVTRRSRPMLLAIAEEVTQRLWRFLAEVEFIVDVFDVNELYHESLLLPELHERCERRHPFVTADNQQVSALLRLMQ